MSFHQIYCFDAYFKYGNEYSCNCKILQLRKEYPDLSKDKAIVEACKKMILPIFYTVLTTICAFLSLIFSGIKPIIDFGWMMTLGLLVSLLVTFTLASLLNIFHQKNVRCKDTEKSFITSILGKF